MALFLSSTLFTGANAETELCIKAGGKLKIATRMEGDKKGEQEKLCVFGRTTVLDKTLRAEIWHEKTIALNKLEKSDFKKTQEALRKERFDPLNKETLEVRNCRLQKGTILKMKDYASEYSICRFDDYSGIEANAFLRGRKDPSNIKMLGIRNVKMVQKKKQKVIEIGD